MKALFLGLGGVGQRHLRNLLALRPEAEIGAVRHLKRSFAIGPTLAADHGVDIMERYRITGFADLDAALAWGPDCAVIASPTSAHVPQALALARAGVPCLVEKPLSHSDQGLDELLELNRATPLMLGYMLRFHPAVVRFLDLARNRVLGPLLSLHVQAASHMPSWHGYERPTDFYAGRRDLGGGAVLTEIHELDLIQALLGLPQRLWSVGGALSSLGLDVEDTVSTLLDYRENGRPLPVTLAVSFVQPQARRLVSAWCEKGLLELDLVANTVRLANGPEGTGEVWDTPGFERNQLFVDEMRCFLRAVEHGTRPSPDLAETLGTHRLAQAMLASLASGGPVDIRL